MRHIVRAAPRARPVLLPSLPGRLEPPPRQRSPSRDRRAGLVRHRDEGDHRPPPASRRLGPRARLEFSEVEQRCQLTADAVVPVRREALPFGRIGAESLHAPISDSLPVAENKITGNIQFRRRIRKINEVILADVGAVYIAADFLDQWHPEKVDLASELYRFERNLILQVLERNRWRMSRAARELGLERSHLYKKLKALGIERQPSD